MRKINPLKFLILIVPSDGEPYLKFIKTHINNMEEIVESKKAIFEYYGKVIIATNRKTEGYIKNNHVKNKECYGTCYFIGNSRNDDFRSLNEKEINNLLTESIMK